MTSFPYDGHSVHYWGTNRQKGIDVQDGIDLLRLARALGCARRYPGDDVARVSAINDVIAGARARLGIPADVDMTRPDLSIPNDLNGVELEVYDLVVRVAVEDHQAPTEQSNIDQHRLRVAGLLCDLVALGASPALRSGEVQ
ncbi:hypothetical protein GZ998_03515 [Actinomyces sp. 594]|uniref:hypothetical protein n=1 Tax=Actinomyces sp. 594 TaxID=2057793 RepID=UPI001C5786F5|nr:hypothetical protein [Actinomyces sp. 594]MBW3068582.1 hypothetical protein [Actinomyces sp. 594]